MPPRAALYTATPMNREELRALWDQIEAHLRRALTTLPKAAADNPAIRDHKHYLDHNELELACDMLEAYADDHPVTPEFWFALHDAAAAMELTDRARHYPEQARR